MKYLLLPLIFLSGVAVPLEAAINARLKDAVHSPALSTLISFGVGLIGAGVLVLTGLLGVFIVLVSLTGLPKVGAAVLIAVIVFGQLLMSLAMDNFGWLGTPKTPLNAWRVAGALLVFGGVLLTNKK